MWVRFATSCREIFLRSLSSRNIWLSGFLLEAPTGSSVSRCDTSLKESPPGPFLFGVSILSLLWCKHPVPPVEAGGEASPSSPAACGSRALAHPSRLSLGSHPYVCMAGEGERVYLVAIVARRVHMAARPPSPKTAILDRHSRREHQVVAWAARLADNGNVGEG